MVLLLAAWQAVHQQDVLEMLITAAQLLALGEPGAERSKQLDLLCLCSLNTDTGQEQFECGVFSLKLLVERV